jgi:hypothetical protein
MIRTLFKILALQGGLLHALVEDRLLFSASTWAGCLLRTRLPFPSRFSAGFTLCPAQF